MVQVRILADNFLFGRSWHEVETLHLIHLVHFYILLSGVVWCA